MSQTIQKNHTQEVIRKMKFGKIRGAARGYKPGLSKRVNISVDSDAFPYFCYLKSTGKASPTISRLLKAYGNNRLPKDVRIKAKVDYLNELDREREHDRKIREAAYEAEINATAEEIRILREALSSLEGTQQKLPISNTSKKERKEDK